MNAGLQTSDDYLQMWNCYIDYLRRSLIAHDDNLDQSLKLKRDAQVEELRDTFQKAINQLYECSCLNFFFFLFKFRVDKILKKCSF